MGRLMEDRRKEGGERETLFYLVDMDFFLIEVRLIYKFM